MCAYALRKKVYLHELFAQLCAICSTSCHVGSFTQIFHCLYQQREELATGCKQVLMNFGVWYRFVAGNGELNLVKHLDRRKLWYVCRGRYVFHKHALHWHAPSNVDLNRLAHVDLCKLAHSVRGPTVRARGLAVGSCLYFSSRRLILGEGKH